MATSAISNTIKDPAGTVVASVPVQAKLMPSTGFRIADFTEVARIVSTTSNASGFWSLNLERNANISPGNTWYEVTEFVPDAQGGKRVWMIEVGASNQTVYASLVSPMENSPTVVPAGTTYLDQASADARYQAVGSLGSGTPAAETPDLAGTAGVATSASRSDHSHPITAGTPASIGLDGTNAESAGTGFARDLHVHAYNPPACRVYHNASQSIPSGALTLAFNSERYDTDTMHDTVTNNSRITIKTAGLYVVTAHLTWSIDNDYTRRIMDLTLNGATIIARQSMEAASNVIAAEGWSLATTYKFAVNDYVEVALFQNNTSAGANSIASSGNFSPEFSATWVGVG